MLTDALEPGRLSPKDEAAAMQFISDLGHDPLISNGEVPLGVSKWAHPLRFSIEPRQIAPQQEIGAIAGALLDDSDQGAIIREENGLTA